MTTLGQLARLGNRRLLTLVFLKLGLATLALHLEPDRHTAAHEAAAGTFAAPAFLGSFTDTITLELGHDGKDREEKFAGAVAGHRIGRNVDKNQIDTTLLEVVGSLKSVDGGTKQTIHLRTNYAIAFLRSFQHLLALRAKSQRHRAGNTLVHEGHAVFSRHAAQLRQCLALAKLLGNRNGPGFRLLQRARSAVDEEHDPLPM